MDEQVKAESEAVLAWIRARPKLHNKLMGYAQVARVHPGTKVGNLAQKRFNEIYEHACKQVGVAV